MHLFEISILQLINVFLNLLIKLNEVEFIAMIFCRQQNCLYCIHLIFYPSIGHRNIVSFDTNWTHAIDIISNILHHSLLLSLHNNTSTNSGYDVRCKSLACVYDEEDDATNNYHSYTSFLLLECSNCISTFLINMFLQKR